MTRGVLAMVVTAAPAPAAAETVSALGTWVVAEVRNDPSMAITALVDDDSSYMGAELTVTPDSITWTTGATNGAGTYDPCLSPRFRRSGDALAVTCAGTPWGPEAKLRPLSRDRLQLFWYDGSILALVRR